MNNIESFFMSLGYDVGHNYRGVQYWWEIFKDKKLICQIDSEAKLDAIIEDLSCWYLGKESSSGEDYVVNMPEGHEANELMKLVYESKKNLLRKTKSYLVGSMEYEEGRDWREKATTALHKMGVTVFDPYHKPYVKDVCEDEVAREKLYEWKENEEWDRLAERFKTVRAYDLGLVDRSDFIIAYINPRVPSWGTAEEIVTACRAKKPTFIIIEGGKKATPLWIFGMFPHKFIYDSLDEVIEVLRKIDSGEKEVDSDRWRLLRPEYR